MGWFIQDAWAQGTGQGDAFFGPIMLVAFGLIFYFLIFRPQNKRAKEHKEMVANLNVGDEVVTAGGVLGKVTDVKEQFVHVEVADGVEIKVQRQTIGAVMPKGTVKSV